MQAIPQEAIYAVASLAAGAVVVAVWVFVMAVLGWLPRAEAVAQRAGVCTCGGCGCLPSSREAPSSTG